jgi:TRAP-type mannitol/chloroaromatic compound transport system substrate-binding protein
MDQAIARAVRMGQKEVVKVYHLKLWEEWDNIQIINIDSKVQEKANEKREMLEKIFSICAQEQLMKKWAEMDELEAALKAKTKALETLTDETLEAETLVAETLADETLTDETLEAETLESAQALEALQPGETRQ